MNKNDKRLEALRASEQAVIAAARDLNMTMPGIGAGDPLSDLDDALAALDVLLASEPDSEARRTVTMTDPIREAARAHVESECRCRLSATHDIDCALVTTEEVLREAVYATPQPITEKENNNA